MLPLIILNYYWMDGRKFKKGFMFFRYLGVNSFNTDAQVDIKFSNQNN